MRRGLEKISNVKEPAICPISVEFRKTMKKPNKYFELLLNFLMPSKALDCNGEIKIRKPRI
jgi:hypothetical protein